MNARQRKTRAAKAAAARWKKSAAARKKRDAKIAKLKAQLTAAREKLKKEQAGANVPPRAKRGKAR